MDEMLEGMTPEQFNEYIAMDQVLPFGDEKICWTNANGFAAICRKLDIILKQWCGIDNPAEVKPKNLIPWKIPEKKKKPKYVNPNAAAAAFLMAVNK